MVESLSKISTPMMGLGFMALAMLILPISDGLVKLLSDRYPILFLNWARYLIGAVIFAPFAFTALRNHRLRSDQISALSGRTILHVTAVSLYFLAIARVPIADALGAYFVAPLVASALAVLVLRERISHVQIVALLVGFSGALIVVRPGPSTDVGMFYAVASGVVFGMFLVSTRKASQTIPPLLTLGFQCGLGTVLLFPFGIFFWTPIQWPDGILIAAAGGIWAAGHFAMIHAFKHTAASVLAPLVYLEILGGAGVGYFLFGYIPSATTVFGIALVIAAGLLVQRSTGTASNT
jgi:drug/metabolite transporter (DMT)-like permease